MASIINTGVSALNAFKRQLETTGHNIANVNTEGYSRQSVQLETRRPHVENGLYLGSGVQTASVRRSYDDFLAARVRDHNSSHEEFRVYAQYARQVDNILADSAAGLDSSLQQFFAAVNDVADDPTSIPARSVMLNRAEQLGERFGSLDGWLEDNRVRLNQDLSYEIDEINTRSQALASVNARIRAQHNGPAGIPGDVLDERDRLVDELSRYTTVSTFEERDGTVNVFVGTGQALVVGITHNTLGVASNPYDAGQKELILQQNNGGQVNITAQMTGGSLGGLLRFRDEVLNSSQNALGRIAVGLASFFNEEHQTGMDLDDELGGGFFSTANPQALGSSANAAGSSVSLSIHDAAQLTAHEYRLDLIGGSWSLVDLDSGATVPLSGTGTSADPLVAAPPDELGFGVVVNAAVDGDSFLLRPTRTGAADVDLLIGDERDIAAAEAVFTLADASNAGTGRIGPGALTTRSTSGVAPAPPVSITLTYNAANELVLPPGTQFVDAAGNPIASNVPYVSGDTYRVDIAGLGIFDFSVSGAPTAGDTFTLEGNAGGVGDNRNARRLADLQTERLMIGGTASIANTYAALIADVGTKTQQAISNASVQENLLAQAEASKAEVSGVNLDEEAADLVRFQQAYQAAAQVINVANSLFDSILGAVRG